jgi:hypothetical protein
MTRERIRETIRASRREQGMPEHVSNARFLGELAAEVVITTVSKWCDGVVSSRYDR